MNFGDALQELKLGKKVARSGWNGKGMWVTLNNDRVEGDTTLPFLVLNYPGGNVRSETPGCAVTAASPYPEGAQVPWAPSQTDVLAEDWDLAA